MDASHLILCRFSVPVTSQARQALWYMREGGSYLVAMHPDQIAFLDDHLRSYNPVPAVPAERLAETMKTQRKEIDGLRCELKTAMEMGVEMTPGVGGFGWGERQGEVARERVAPEAVKEMAGILEVKLEEAFETPLDATTPTRPASTRCYADPTNQGTPTTTDQLHLDLEDTTTSTAATCCWPSAPRNTYASVRGGDHPGPTTEVGEREASSPQQPPRSPAPKGTSTPPPPLAKNQIVVLHGASTHHKPGTMRRRLEEDNKGIKVHGIRWLLKGPTRGKRASSLVIYLGSCKYRS